MTRMRLGTLVALAIGLAARAAAHGATVSCHRRQRGLGGLARRLAQAAADVGRRQDRPWQSRRSRRSTGARSSCTATPSRTDRAAPVLHLFGADGKRVTANVMPVYSGATIPVYPIGMDVDWNRQRRRLRLLLLRLRVQQHPPRLLADVLPTTRACIRPTRRARATRCCRPSSGRGSSPSTRAGRCCAARRPAGALHDLLRRLAGRAGHRRRRRAAALGRATAASTGSQVALKYTVTDNASPYGTLEEGVLIGERAGNLPSDVDRTCAIAGQGVVQPRLLLARRQADRLAGRRRRQGRRRAEPRRRHRVVHPHLRPRHAVGHRQVADFGGATLARPAGGSTGGGSTGGGSTGGGSTGGGSTARLRRQRRHAGRPEGDRAREGLDGLVRPRHRACGVTVPAAGRISATATVPARAARKLQARASLALAADVRGLVAAAKAVKVASGRATAATPGAVTLRLKPTAVAKRKARRLKGVKLTIRVARDRAPGR